MWGFIHVLYLVDWGSRLGTVLTWARTLTCSRNRTHRIITFEQAEIRAHRASRRSRRAERNLVKVLGSSPARWTPCSETETTTLEAPEQALRAAATISAAYLVLPGPPCP
jgi:hypothetical protein